MNDKWASNIVEIQRMEIARYYKKAYFPGEHFYIFEKLNNQCKVDIIFIKSFYFNGNTEFSEIIFALLENFSYIFENLFL